MVFLYLEYFPKFGSMIGAPIDIEKELRRQKARDTEEQKAVLEVFQSLLSEEEQKDIQIEENLRNETCNIDNINFDKLDPDRIYSLEQIKNICIKYRLRFLDTTYFKGEFPYEAISKIKALQKEQEIELNSFKIIAPSELFKLGDANDKDPLLFLNLGNGYYYFIHKWGQDLSWYRRLLSWPIAEPMNAVACIATTLALLVYLLPESWFLNPSNVPDISSYRVFLFFYLFIATCGLTLFFGLAFHKNFSESEWNSQYFN